MSDKKTLIDIETRYNGSGAQAAKNDIAQLNGASTGGMKAERSEMDQVKQKADALSTSSKELSKTKIALNAVTLILRGSFREAALQLDKLSVAWRGFSVISASAVGIIMAVIGVINTLISKWKEHKAALEETNKQLKDMQWQRVQEMLDLKFDKGRKELSDWVESLQKAETQAKNTAAAILLVETARNDAEMARIDLNESRGAITPMEAAQQRLDLGKNRDMARLNTDRSTAESTITEQQSIVYSSTSKMSDIKGVDDTNQKALSAKIEELKQAGVLDSKSAGDLLLISKQGGKASEDVMARLQSAVSENRKKRAKDAADERIAKLTPSYGARTAREIVGDLESRLIKQYEEQDPSIDSAVSLAKRAGLSYKVRTEQEPVLQAQIDAAKGKLSQSRSVLQTIPLRESEINDRYAAGFLKNTPDAQATSMSGSAARRDLLQSVVTPGRRDNTGQTVQSSADNQAAWAQRYIDQAQSAVMGGADAGAVADRLAQLLGQLGAKITRDRADFNALVDQLDGVLNNIQEIKSRTKANSAGD